MTTHPDKVAAAALLLQQLGVTIEELANFDPDGGTARVTVGEFVPVVLANLPAGTRRTYRAALRFVAEGWSVRADEVALLRRIARELEVDLPTDAEMIPCEQRPTDARRRGPGIDDDYRLVFAGWADRPLESISGSDLARAEHLIRLRARLTIARRSAFRSDRDRFVPDHDGRGSVETFIAAMRRLFAEASNEPTIAMSRDDSPAAVRRKPRRRRSRRRMLTDEQRQEAWDVTRAGGNDPELDALLFRFHIGSGARRIGALNLRLRDLDEVNARVYLREKNEDASWQPVAPSLVRDLVAFAAARHAERGDDPVFRYRNGRPITKRRYDYWLGRVQRGLPWADEVGFDAHTLRHHAGSVIERLAGKAVAEAFLRHSARSVTDAYTTALDQEVAAAVSLMTGERHPLA